MYPYVVDGAFIHYFDDHGLLFSPYQNYVLSDIEMFMINRFNGEDSLDKIIDDISLELGVKEKEKVGEILLDFINSKSKVIRLSEKSNLHTLNISGEKNRKIPLNVIVSLTNKCNLKCIHCYKSCGDGRSDELSKDRTMNMLKYLAKKVPAVQLTGGEPMLHKNFKDILKYSVENFKTTVTTTGMLINSENVEDFRGVSSVQVSLYSHKGDKHDGITLVPGSYEKVISAVKELASRKINVSIAAVVYKDNYREIEEIAKLAAELGAKIVRFGLFIPLGRGSNLKDSWSLNNEELQFVTEETQRLSEKYKNKISIETWEEENQDKHLRNKYNCLDCGAGLFNWAISERGIIKPCEFFTDEVFSLGNILEKDVEEIIDSYNFDEFPSCMNKWKKDLTVQGSNIEDICIQIKNYLKVVDSGKGTEIA